MKIYATTKFIIIGIIIFIIIMIVTYIFKIIEAGNNEPFWVKPAHVHNTGTLYLGDWIIGNIFLKKLMDGG